jgi:hypothetical protein
MPQKSFLVDLNDVPAARDWLSREVEQLEVEGKRIAKIHYPKLVAEELRITEVGDLARYGKYEAVGRRGEYGIVIEYND